MEKLRNLLSDKILVQVYWAMKLCRLLMDIPTIANILFKCMEEVRGFLGHLAMTYNLIATYFLMGLHLTLASIHLNRDKDGWKLSKRDWMAYLWDAPDMGKLSCDEFSKLFNAAVKTDHLVGTRTQKPSLPPPKEILVVPCLYLVCFEQPRHVAIVASLHVIFSLFCL
jgi:hypothetical protein